MKASSAKFSSSDVKRLGRVIFIRHGESIWNVTDPSRGLVSRFTGWVDVPLTDKGLKQASAVGRCLKLFGIKYDAVYTSLLNRSKETFRRAHLENIITTDDTTDDDNYLDNIPIINSWRLNERHYGALVGLSKEEATVKMGEELVMKWRKSWNEAPPKMNEDDIRSWMEVKWARPLTIVSQKGKQTNSIIENNVKVPYTESLEDCAQRILPLWRFGIIPRLLRGETVLIVAHANSIRSLLKHVDGSIMTDGQLRQVSIPSAVPLVYDFCENPNPEDNNDESKLQVYGTPSSLGMRGRYLISKELLSFLDYDINNNNNDYQDTIVDDGDSASFYDLIENDLESAINYADNKQLNIKKIHDDIQSNIPIDKNNEALVITDSKGKILYTNESWSKLCGFTNDDVVGKTSSILQGPDSDANLISTINSRLTSGLPTKARIINYRKSGKAFLNHFTVLPIYDWNNKSKLNNNINNNGDNVEYYNNFSIDNFDNKNISNNDNNDDITQLDDDGGMPFFGPSHYVARLEHTPDLEHLQTLSKDQILKRDTVL